MQVDLVFVLYRPARLLQELVNMIAGDLFRVLVAGHGSPLRAVLGLWSNKFGR